MVAHGFEIPGPLLEAAAFGRDVVRPADGPAKFLPGDRPPARRGGLWRIPPFERQAETAGLDPALLENALLATPHIAGYSEQGKANATAMAVGAVARRFALPLEGWYPAVAPSHPRPIGWDELAATIGARYDIAAESDTLKRYPERFEALRNGYSYREEYF